VRGFPSWSQLVKYIETTEEVFRVEGGDEEIPLVSKAAIKKIKGVILSHTPSPGRVAKLLVGGFRWRRESLLVTTPANCHYNHQGRGGNYTTVDMEPNTSERRGREVTILILLLLILLLLLLLL
jgi:hypothetical protein